MPAHHNAQATTSKSKKASTAKDTTTGSPSSSEKKHSSPPPLQQPKASTANRPRYVLFPEVYLPALDPMPVPLMGITVSPLLDATGRTTVGVLLHIVYFNGRLFTYEIRVAKRSRDPPSFDHVFL
ncbi:hypothetical protein BGW41_004958 [Actinomortierella wolfii]|nr:hypothetical protein BGW41_004958 [Actinomortierella wolfii]